MKLKNLSFIAILLIIISLSSCDDDKYYVEPGTLDGGKTIYADRNGDFLGIFRMSDANLKSPSRSGYINYIRFAQGYIGLKTDKDYAENGLELKIEGTNIGISFPRIGSYVEYDDPGVQDFLYRVVEEINARGYVNIVIQGYTNSLRDVRLDVDLFMDVDVEFRN